jgi:hypothetical protein
MAGSSAVPRLTLTLEENDDVTITSLNRGLGQLVPVVVEPRTKSGLPIRADAAYVSFMMGVELGAGMALGKSHVVRNSDANRAAGQPRFIVTGIALDPARRPSDPAEEFTLQMRAIFEAIQEFNRAGHDRIASLLATYRWLAPQNIAPDAAGRVIRQVYEEFWPEANRSSGGR